MSGKLMNTESRFSKAKQLCAEYLWLIVLFAPLIVVAILVSNNGHSTTNQPGVTSTSKGGTFVKAAVQLTTTELAAIVAKPLGELMLMEVYFDRVEKYVILEVDHTDPLSNRAFMPQHDGKPV